MQQLYTGFRLLQRRGIVKLEQTIVREEIRNAHAPQHARYARYAHQRVVVNKHVTVHYDVHDSREIDEEYLDKSDFYFKRSYSSSYLNGLRKMGRSDGNLPNMSPSRGRSCQRN